MLYRVEHSVVGPVDVLEGDDYRPAGGDRLDAGAEGGEEGLAQALRVLLVGHELLRHLHAEQAADQRGLAVSGGLSFLARQLADVEGELAPGRVGRVGSTMPHSARSTSASAQKTIPLP